MTLKVVVVTLLVTVLTSGCWSPPATPFDKREYVTSTPG